MFSTGDVCIAHDSNRDSWIGGSKGRASAGFGRSIDSTPVNSFPLAAAYRLFITPHGDANVRISGFWSSNSNIMCTWFAAHHHNIERCIRAPDLALVVADHSSGEHSDRPSERLGRHQWTLVRKYRFRIANGRDRPILLKNSMIEFGVDFDGLHHSRELDFRSLGRYLSAKNDSRERKAGSKSRVWSFSTE